MIDTIDKQNKEFDAMERLTSEWRRLTRTAVVDDNYPEVRHGYESALRQFREALIKNRPEWFSNPGLNELARQCHAANIKWWQNPETGLPVERNKGELMMLMVSEISEMMEGERKGLMDTHLSRRKMAEVEAVDILIRLFDYAGAYGFDLSGAFEEKMKYNAQREDHKDEARLLANGKKW